MMYTRVTTFRLGLWFLLIHGYLQKFFAALDSMINDSHRAVAFDADRYEDPFAFRPDRWLSGNEMEKARGVRARDFAFGYGRR